MEKYHYQGRSVHSYIMRYHYIKSQGGGVGSNDGLMVLHTRHLKCHVVKDAVLQYEHTLT